MRPITIRSYKYDGQPRDEYTGLLYEDDAESCLVFVPPGTMICDHRTQTWERAPDGVLERYFKTRWYAIWYVAAQHSNINHMYVHVSMPATVTATTITWVDLDIDYRVYTDGRMEQRDLDEYHANMTTMAYPLHIQDAVRAACTEIESLGAPQHYPFNYASHAALYQQISQQGLTTEVED
jgi:protein associated with RNAse G/E